MTGQISPHDRAKQLVEEVKPNWNRITSGKINIRRELLDKLCVSVGPNQNRTLAPGIAGLYLFKCAQKGDKVAYDLLKEVGFEPDFPCPKKPGGVSQNAARDFTVDFLSTILLIEFPDLSRGANSATAEGKSAVDMIRKALEDASLGCIDYRGSEGSAPTPRSMEQAIDRFRKNAKYRELYWPEIDEV